MHNHFAAASIHSFNLLSHPSYQLKCIYYKLYMIIHALASRCSVISATFYFAISSRYYLEPLVLERNNKLMSMIICSTDLAPVDSVSSGSMLVASNIRIWTNRETAVVCIFLKFIPHMAKQTAHTTHRQLLSTNRLMLACTLRPKKSDIFIFLDIMFDYPFFL
jgi:hypothetical protein